MNQFKSTHGVHRLGDHWMGWASCRKGGTVEFGTTARRDNYYAAAADALNYEIELARLYRSFVGS